jgi:hypothetical protein
MTKGGGYDWQENQHGTRGARGRFPVTKVNFYLPGALPEMVRTVVSWDLKGSDAQGNKTSNVSGQAIGLDSRGRFFLLWETYGRYTYLETLEQMRIGARLFPDAVSVCELKALGPAAVATLGAEGIAIEGVTPPNVRKEDRWNNAKAQMAGGLVYAEQGKASRAWYNDLASETGPDDRHDAFAQGVDWLML